MARNPDQDTFDRFAEGWRERGRFGDNESRDGERVTKSNLLDLAMIRHAQTEKAVLVSDNGDPARATWLPKSLVEFADTGQPQRVRGVILQPVMVTLPDWLAEKKKLV